jgi:hypothetical protein
MRYFLLILLASISVAPGCLAGTASPPTARWQWDRGAEKCTPGLYPQPSGPFAVLLFCEDAIGDYISVVHLRPIGAPTAGAWSTQDRYWYEPLWGDDVTGFRWSSDGKTLFVTTSEIYGSGGAFALFLANRQSRQLLPKKPVALDDPGPGFRIGDVPKRLSPN